MRTYAWIFLLIPLLGLTGCSLKKKKVLDRRITLRRGDKIPYGTYIAYENLKWIFPGAAVSVNRSSPSQFTEGEGKKAYIIIVPRMNPSPDELSAILNFVGQGNSVFISAFSFGDTLMHNLNVKPAFNGFAVPVDSMKLSVYNPVTNDSLAFSYPGEGTDEYALSIDSQYTTVLGRDQLGKPNFLKFGYKGGGALYLHFSPLAFTNFFLLHKKNMAYYENALSYMPLSVTEVKWDEYFRYERRGFSAFQYILSNASLRWAFWLVLLLFLVIYLIESKRRQRLIPVIAGLRNTSLDFVKTIGRLYYGRRDNRNLALKMAALFQDHVWTRYRLTMPQASEEDAVFAERLAYKTGYDLISLRDLLYAIRQLRDAPSLSDQELLEFNKRLEEFYKHA